MAARTGRVTRVTVDGRVYVELSDVAPGFEFGPVLDTVGGLTVGDRVITTGLARDPDALVVIGLLGRSHTHHADDIVDGVLALNRLPVAPSGNANPTQIVRADDARLADARTPTAHTHDDRYYTEAEVDAKLARQPAMLCHAASAQATNSGVVTQLSQWLYTYSDPGILFSVPGNFTVQQAGLYTITLQTMFRNDHGSGGMRGCMIQRNGGQIAGHYAPPIAAQADYASAGCTTDHVLAAGDVITFWSLQTSGGVVVVHTSPYTYCSIRRVSA